MIHICGGTVSPNKIRILFADGHRVVREQLAARLRREIDFATLAPLEVMSILRRFPTKQTLVGGVPHECNRALESNKDSHM
jgi:hypothetical protein